MQEYEGYSKHMTHQHKFQVILPKVPISLNRLMRSHWRVRVREKKRWMELLLAKIGKNRWKPRRYTHMKIIVHTTHLQDEDNLTGSLKPLIDAMKPQNVKGTGGLGLIIDDNPDNLWLEVEQVRVHRDKHKKKVSIFYQRDQDESSCNEERKIKFL